MPINSQSFVNFHIQQLSRICQATINIIRLIVMQLDKEQHFKLRINQKQFSKLSLLKNHTLYFHNKLNKQIPNNYLNDFNIISKKDPDFARFSLLFRKKINRKDLGITEKESRAIGCFVGLAIGDALGSTTQFQDFIKHRKDPFFKSGFKDIQDKIGKEQASKRFDETRVWTDDCSMALAIADSLLLNQFEFNPISIRYLFTLWLYHGLNNGQREESIGLGGNISISMKFLHGQLEPISFHLVLRNIVFNRYCIDKGTGRNSGNGSLMRLAPIPIAFRESKQNAMKYSALQSYTTHNGIEAAECCKLLGGLIVTLINRKDQQDWKAKAQTFLKFFQTKCLSVKFLANSQMQSEQHFEKQLSELNEEDLKTFRIFNSSVKDRNWNWKDVNFTYSETRLQRNPAYVGSYCMDALAMALHIVWHKKSFRECAIWAANMGGDCDSVGAVACQIAGAVWGFNADVIDLYSQMKDFTSQRYSIFIKAYKLTKGRQNKIAFEGG